MSTLFNIIFDLEKNEEILVYNKLYKQKNEYISSPILHPKSKPLGSFLLNFLNTDMRKQDNIKKFITEYCFVYYYKKINKKYEDKYINYTFTITEDEYIESLNKILKKYSEDFITFYELFWDIAIKKYRYQQISKDFKFTDPEFSKYSKNKLEYLKPVDYFDDLNNEDIREVLGEISLDFNFTNFLNIKIPNYISYSYKTNDYMSILYLSLRQIASSKYLICKCENCGKFFIPFTNHDTKYCNNIFKGTKTCKDLAPEIIYKQKLEQDPLLKKYRARYQTLQKSASLNPERNTNKYEDFKKIGAIKKNNYLNNKITAEEFENWIESTKIRK